MRGFSLIELVVVILLTAILAALAIPMFTDAESKATWYHEQVKAGVRYAQRQAVAQRRCVFVQVAASEVRLFYGDASCVITATPLTFLSISAEGASPGDPTVLTAPAGVTITPNPTSFWFNGLGQPSGAVSLSVAGRPIIVAAETGYVQ
jgi:MSHA pilin protein MshC